MGEKTRYFSYLKELIYKYPQESGSDTASSEDELDVIDVPGEHDETCCHICYDRELDEEDPLLSFCKCDGSVKYTHLVCLKQWLWSKVLVEVTGVCDLQGGDSAESTHQRPAFHPFRIRKASVSLHCSRSYLLLR